MPNRGGGIGMFGTGGAGGDIGNDRRRAIRGNRLLQEVIDVERRGSRWRLADDHRPARAIASSTNFGGSGTGAGFGGSRAVGRARVARLPVEAETMPRRRCSPDRSTPSSRAPRPDCRRRDCPPRRARCRPQLPRRRRRRRPLRSRAPSRLRGRSRGATSSPDRRGILGRRLCGDDRRGRFAILRLARGALRARGAKARGSRLHG